MVSKSPFTLVTNSSKKISPHPFGQCIGNHIVTNHPTSTATGLFQVALEDGNVNGCSLILSLCVGTHQLVHTVVEGSGVCDSYVWNGCQLSFLL